MTNTCKTRALGMLVCCAVCIGNVNCVGDVANRYYAAERFPPKPFAEVEVLSMPPSRPHEVIADFQSRGDTPESLRRKAARIGADAVIVTRLGGDVPWDTEWADQKTSSGGRIVGTAIRFK